MRILFLGDVMGRSGRQGISDRLPALRELGAERVQIVRTSDRTVAAISEWPDQETRDAASRAIQAVRDKVRKEDLTRMTGEMSGAVVASV